MKALLQPDGRWLAPWDQAAAWSQPAAVAPVSLPRVAEGFASGVPAGNHPLAEPALSAALKRRVDEITAAFARIEPVLRQLAPRQFEDGSAELIHRQIADSLGVEIGRAHV